MRHPALRLAGAALAGVSLGLRWPGHGGEWAFLALAVALGTWWRYREELPGWPVLLLSTFLLGSAWGSAAGSEPPTLANWMEECARGETLWVEGVIQEAEVNETGVVRALLRPERVWCPGRRAGRARELGLFQWYYREGEVVRRGDRVRAQGTLERLRPPLNPGEFSGRDYLRRRGVRAVLRSHGGVPFILLGRVWCPGRRAGRARELGLF
ncbi:MAG: ComEC/Rec2 family competence protein, partial [Bacillota bacterium]|nr:ComEC/Rec2 family competence protein [Bacillota bacterium]